jgi:multiple sugar transport system substrate-binding protein
MPDDSRIDNSPLLPHNMTMNATSPFRFLLLCCLSLVLLAACQQPQTAADPLQATPTAEVSLAEPITLIIASRQGNISKGLILAAERWEAQTGITVHIEEYAYTYLQEQIFVDVQRNTSQYDVVVLDDPWFPSLAGNGYLVPLSAFNYTADPDFLQRSLELGMWPPPEGPRHPYLDPRKRPELYALPLVGNVQMFWYRNDLVPPLSDLSEMVELLNDAADVPNGLYPYAYTGGAGNPIVTEFSAWNWAYGGDIFDENWRVVLTQPESIRALTDMISLTRASLPASRLFRSSRDAGEAVLKGQALASTIWPSHITELAQGQTPVNMTITTFPGQVNNTSQMGHWLLAVPVTAPHKQEAFNFIMWATSPEMMKAAVYEGVAPARHSVFQDEDLIGRYPWLAETELAIQNARWRPRTPEWPSVEYILGNYLNQALDRQMTPEQALTEATIAIERLMTAAGYYD